MLKDLARVDYVREFIDLLEKNAPTAAGAGRAFQARR
jgi:hypothetical protein